MQNEFYGDRKDVWKWSVTLNAAGPRHRILYVPMLTLGPGNDFGNPGPEARGDVVQFFDCERKQFAEPIRTVRRLKSWLGDRLEIIDGYYEHRNRSNYFLGVQEILRQRVTGLLWLVLIDPDIGIEPSNPDKRHICKAELATVWESLNDGDVLIVYQHADRSDSGLETRESRLREVVGDRTIERITRPSVTFLKVIH